MTLPQETLPSDSLPIQSRRRRQVFVDAFSGAVSIDRIEHIATLKTMVRWTLLGGAAGVLAGIASAIFLLTLGAATYTREANPWLLYLLPLAGLGVGRVYSRFAGTAARGNNLVVEQVNDNHAPIPLRMAPLVLGGTIITHLFGGSAGREGTAIQMGASLADGLRRLFGLTGEDRRLMLMAGISGGFGSVFGVPLAGFVFGMEVQRVGRIRYDGLIPCLVAATVGDLVTRALGVTHTRYPLIASVELEPALLLKVAVAGIAFGAASLIFIELTHAIKHVVGALIRPTPLRMVAGGLAIIALTGLVGTNDYLGLSLPLISSSVSGSGVPTFAFLLKLIFTAVTLGTGFLGGEVTPLLVVGATLGFTLGRLLGVDPAWLASIGLVAVFAGASNTPMASMLMGIELFGGGSPLYFAAGCFVAYLASGHRSIYSTQRLETPKAHGLLFEPAERLTDVAERRANRRSIPPPAPRPAHEEEKENPTA